MQEPVMITFNKPEPRPHDFHSPQEAVPRNPAMRGLLLYFGALLLGRFDWLQKLIWRNAGFDRLRDRAELNGIAPRYEPIVIKSNGVLPQKGALQQLNIDLLAETWAWKRPVSKVHWSILDFHEAYKAGRTTPTVVAEKLLSLITTDGERTAHSVAFLQIRKDLVLKAAEESTERWRQGRPLSLLDGVPVAVKDELDVSGYDKNLGSKLDFKHEDDATSYCVQVWLDSGAILIGKTNMHELGCDITTNNPNHGTPLNPNNEGYYCGGSSGGSAYVVAAGLLPLSEGNDGGGSIRVPSSFCGLYGLKTSHGRISRYPSANIAASTGVSGPLAANMVDLEIGYRILASPNASDVQTAMFAKPERISMRPRKRTLGVFQPWLDSADAVVQHNCERAIDYLVNEIGYERVDITLPLLREGQIAHAMTILCELSSAITLSDIAKVTPASQILLHIARQNSAIDLLQGQKVRTIIMEHLSYLFDKYPGLIIVSPTVADAGWEIQNGDLDYGLSDANKQLRNMQYVWLANFAGCPAISVPCGFAEPSKTAKGRGKIPIGLMGMAAWCGEDELLEFGYDCERSLDKVHDGGRVRPSNWTDILA